MTTYIPANPEFTAPTSLAALPGAWFAADNPLLSLWMLPITLSQTWLTAWVKPTPGDAERIADAAVGGQVPVPAPIQESKDSAVFA